VLTRGTGHCICLRCFAQQTGGYLPMPKGLRQQIFAALAELERA
jgi:hypothetical protein